MRVSLIFLAILLAACGRPPAPESPNSSSYGQIIKGEHRPPLDRYAPDHLN